MTIEKEIAARCFGFEEKHKMNKLGFFLLDNNEMKSLEMTDMEKQFVFGSIDDHHTYSRGMGYYQPSLSAKIIKAIKKNVEQAAKYNNWPIQYALNEFLLNHFAITWYRLRYHENTIYRNLESAVYQQLQIIAGNIYSIIAGGKNLKGLDWELLLRVDKTFKVSAKLYRIPECDNKIEIIKELSWLSQSGLINQIDEILFPMCGSLNLMIFASVMLGKKCYPLDLGFHDQQVRKTECLSDFVAPYSDVLVLDDNIGSGKTIQACNIRLDELGCNTITRVCEIPWDVLFRINNFSVIRDYIELPTPKENFRNLSKKIFTQRMKEALYGKVYHADNLFICLNTEIESMYKRICYLKEANAVTESQLKYMRDEFCFYEESYRMRWKYV